MSDTNAVEVNWPVVGGIYEWSELHPEIASRVRHIDGTKVTHEFINKKTGSVINTGTTNITVYREHYLPPDQSPIPDLVAALREFSNAMRENEKPDLLQLINALHSADKALAKAGSI